ncbi:MAG: TM2 domain protein [Candidatus Omnitrophica bacterium ADurb.Bin314]|jgi:hypothetical protein|nr:MAG: TM2 domain protein [Candidatus Omnitrophica bacterium ADurb.Bin314]
MGKSVTPPVLGESCFFREGDRMMKNKWFAAFLSLAAPGAGQLYLGEKAKGITFLCITAGLWSAIATGRSWLNLLFLGPICLFVMVPSSIDAYQSASGKPRTFTGDSVLYVIFMLLTVGPFAVPLLWRSPKFSKTLKVLWTVFVVLMAFVIIYVLNQIASVMDAYLKQNSLAVSF